MGNAKKKNNQDCLLLLIFGICLADWVCTLQRHVQNGKEAVFVCGKGLVVAEVTALFYSD